VDANLIRKELLARHEIVLGGGQQSLDGKIFRVGHLGLVSKEDIEAVMAGLLDVLPDVGFTPA
jgi:aspartate aminotransferase-like enzyme